jgi:hypothetical protein
MTRNVFGKRAGRRRLLERIKSFVNKRLPTCAEATSLVSRSLDDGLTFRERLLLGAHLNACRLCRLFRRQTFFLRATARRAADSVEIAPVAVRLSADARARIALALQQQT